MNVTDVVIVWRVFFYSIIVLFLQGIWKHTQWIWNLSRGFEEHKGPWPFSFRTKQELGILKWPLGNRLTVNSNRRPLIFLFKIISFPKKLLLPDFYYLTILLLLWSLAVGCDLVASRLEPEVDFLLPKNYWQFFLYALPGCLFRFCNRLSLPPLQLYLLETSESWQHWSWGTC